MSYWKDIARYYWERLVLHISVHFLLYSFSSLFVCCYSCAFFKIKKCKNDTYIKKRRKPTTRHIVCPVQNTPRVHSYHVDLFNHETPSFVRGLSNPHIGLHPYLEKLKIRVKTRNSINKNSTEHQLFAYTQLNDQTVLFNMHHLFALNLNV